MENQNFEFKISAHATRRVWAVYVVIGTHVENRITFLYVGKVGDNSDGCNPIVSRIGNHFSHTKVHSTLRNKVGTTEEYNYEIFYTSFGEYFKENRIEDLEKINECERQLNLMIQKRKPDNIELKNPYFGKGYIKKEVREKRSKLLNINDLEKLSSLVDYAMERINSQ